MAKQQITNDINIQFPIMGIDRQRAHSLQNPASCYDGVNVRAFDPVQDRARGGSREGMEFEFSGTVTSTDHPIQLITQITSSERHTINVRNDYLTYSKGVSNGMAIANNVGTLLYTKGDVASDQLALTCWDDDDNVYSAFVNTTSGAVTLYKHEIDGTQLWSNSGNITVATGNLRCVAGMVYIEGYIYLAQTITVGSSYRISKINATTGSITTSGWLTTTLLANLIFSTNSINCLGAIGYNLGIEVKNSAATHGVFYIYNTRTAKQVAAKTHTARGGSVVSNARTAVCSDGTTYWYVLCNEDVYQLRKLNMAATEIWAYNTSNINGLFYDGYSKKLLTVHSATPSCRTISLTDGSLVSSADPIATVTNISWISGGRNGTFVLYRDSVASNDLQGIDTTYAVTFGPSTKANTLQSGNSVNPAGPAEPLEVGTRLIRKLLICSGVLYHFDEDGPVAVTGGDVFHASTPQIYAAQNGEDIYFADGSGYYYYSGIDNEVYDWTLDSGTLPRDADGHPARLVESWNGRVMLGGLLGYGSSFYASAQYDPLDFDYTPTTPSATMAFSGNADLAGSVGALLTAIVPYSDEVCILGCDHELWQIAGDPGSGGTITVFSKGIGMAFGRPYAFDPEGLFYFFGSDCRIYKMVPGAPPVPASQPIDSFIFRTDLAANNVVMAWDVERVGLKVWITPFDQTQPGQVFVWEKRTNSWFRDEYATVGMYPWAVHTFDGDKPNDRSILLGGRDGKVRRLSSSATTDAGKAIPSRVTIGPLRTQSLTSVILERIWATLGSESGDVRYKVFSGEYAEEVVNKIDQSVTGEETWDVSGYFSAGRSIVHPIRKDGFVFYIELSSSSRWTMERMAGTIRALGPIRRWS